MIASAHAEQAPKKRLIFGKWHLVCQDSGDIDERCAVTQMVRASSDSNTAITLIFQMLKESSKTRLKIITPQDVSFAEGISILVKGKQLGAIPYKRCFGNGCLAYADLDMSHVGLFFNNSFASVLVHTASKKKPYSLRFSTKYFRDAFRSMYIANHNPALMNIMALRNLEPYIAQPTLIVSEYTAADKKGICRIIRPGKAVATAKTGKVNKPYIYKIIGDIKKCPNGYISIEERGSYPLNAAENTKLYEARAMIHSIIASQKLNMKEDYPITDVATVSATAQSSALQLKFGILNDVMTWEAKKISKAIE